MQRNKHSQVKESTHKFPDVLMHEHALYLLSTDFVVKLSWAKHSIKQINTLTSPGYTKMSARL